MFLLKNTILLFIIYLTIHNKDYIKNLEIGLSIHNLNLNSIKPCYWDKMWILRFMIFILKIWFLSSSTKLIDGLPRFFFL